MYTCTHTHTHMHTHTHTHTHTQTQTHSHKHTHTHTHMYTHTHTHTHTHMMNISRCTFTNVLCMHTHTHTHTHTYTHRGWEHWEIELRKIRQEKSTEGNRGCYVPWFFRGPSTAWWRNWSMKCLWVCALKSTGPARLVLFFWPTLTQGKQ